MQPLCVSLQKCRNKFFVSFLLLTQQVNCKGRSNKSTKLWLVYKFKRTTHNMQSPSTYISFKPKPNTFSCFIVWQMCIFIIFLRLFHDRMSRECQRSHSYLSIMYRPPQTGPLGASRRSRRHAAQPATSRHMLYKNKDTVDRAHCTQNQQSGSSACTSLTWPTITDTTITPAGCPDTNCYITVTHPVCPAGTHPSTPLPSPTEHPHTRFIYLHNTHMWTTGENKTLTVKQCMPHQNQQRSYSSFMHLWTMLALALQVIFIQ